VVLTQGNFLSIKGCEPCGSIVFAGRTFHQFRHTKHQLSIYIVLLLAVLGRPYFYAVLLTVSIVLTALIELSNRVPNVTQLALVSQLHYLHRMTTNETTTENEKDTSQPLVDTDTELENPSQTMVFLKAILLSEDSPFALKAEGVDPDLLADLAEAAAYVCVYTVGHDIKRAGTQIAGESIRSNNPTKANYGKGVSQALNAIADAMLPEVTA